MMNRTADADRVHTRLATGKSRTKNVARYGGVRTVDATAVEGRVGPEQAVHDARCCTAAEKQRLRRRSMAKLLSAPRNGRHNPFCARPINICRYAPVGVGVW